MTHLEVFGDSLSQPAHVGIDGLQRHRESKGDVWVMGVLLESRRVSVNVGE